MRRREFITALGGAAAWPLMARGEQPDPMRLIGVLMGFVDSDPAGQSAVAALRSAFTKLGWTEGSNLRVELRWGDGDPDMLGTFAKELVDLRPDALLGGSTAVTGALARETRTIPIVFTVVADPIGSGFVASLAHPGGNITGFNTAVDPAMGVLFIVAELALILRLPVPSYLVWAIVGSMGAATVLSFTILAEYFPSEIAGQANAALNILHIFGAFLLQYAIGVIVDIWGSKDGHYPMIAYQAAFTIILSLQVLAWSWYFSSMVTVQRSQMWNETQRAGS
jgi:ABC transporter substrate binding protein